MLLYRSPCFTSGVRPVAEPVSVRVGTWFKGRDTRYLTAGADRRHDGSTRLVYHGLKREGEATCCEDETTDSQH